MTYESTGRVTEIIIVLMAGVAGVLLCGVISCSRPEPKELNGLLGRGGSIRMDSLSQEGFKSAAALLVAWQLTHQKLRVGDDLSGEIVRVSSQFIQHIEKRHPNAIYTIAGLASLPGISDQPPSIRLIEFPEALEQLFRSFDQIAREAGTLNPDPCTSVVGVYCIVDSGDREESVKLILSVNQRAAEPAEAIVRCIGVVSITDEEWDQIKEKERL